MDDEILGARSGQKSERSRQQEVENELEVSASNKKKRVSSPTHSELMDDELGDIIPSIKASNRGTPILDNHIALKTPAYTAQGRIKIDFV